MQHKGIIFDSTLMKPYSIDDQPTTNKKKKLVSNPPRFLVALNKLMQQLNKKNSNNNDHQSPVLELIPRLFQLKNTCSSWNETIEFYVYRIPTNVVIRFFQYIDIFVRLKLGKSDVTPVRGALLWISKFVRDSGAVKDWSDCVYWSMNDNGKENRIIFGTEEVRDAFAMVAQFVTPSKKSFNNSSSDDALCCWCKAIVRLVIGENDDDDDHSCATHENLFNRNRKLFGTTEILKSFVSLSKVVSSSSDSCFRYCQALSAITSLKENQQLFGTEEIRDSMIRVSDFVRHPCESENWFKILEFLTDNNESNKELFFVGDFLAAKQRVEKRIAFPKVTVCKTEN